MSDCCDGTLSRILRGESSSDDFQIDEAAAVAAAAEEREAEVLRKRREIFVQNDGLLRAVAAEYNLSAGELLEKFLPPNPDAAVASGTGASAPGGQDDADPMQGVDEEGEAPRESGGVGSREGDLVERAKFIPLRLDMNERRLLRLCEAALDVSEYTERVDVYGLYTKKARRCHEQLKDICSVLCGLLLANDYEAGTDLMENHQFKEREWWFAKVFEIGRRHKITNPEGMRTDYGKLIYALMDSQVSNVAELLECNVVKPVQTVYDMLKGHDALHLLEDPKIHMATLDIKQDGKKTLAQLQRDSLAKSRAVDSLADKYGSDGGSSKRGSWWSASWGGGSRDSESKTGLTSDMVRQCLLSIGDNNAFLQFNRDPIDRCIGYLHKYFDPSSNSMNERNALSIGRGIGGARLSHNHSTQFQYVLQTLTLWREVMHDMFKLWYLAEMDLLDAKNRYSLTDTGQGLNRVQACPRTHACMSGIVRRVQARLGSWIGSSVIHMGDHNVPNALMFIDKYTQVPRILGPLSLVVEEIPKLCRLRGVDDYIQTVFDGPENAIVAILQDFFRHGFDGSGADNFFDAGSCIDGRLTSAWNWCSNLEKKPFFPLFKLAGFSSWGRREGREHMKVPFIVWAAVSFVVVFFIMAICKCSPWARRAARFAAMKKRYNFVDSDSDSDLEKGNGRRQQLHSMNLSGRGGSTNRSGAPFPSVRDEEARIAALEEQAASLETLASTIRSEKVQRSARLSTMKAAIHSDDAMASLASEDVNGPRSHRSAHLDALNLLAEEDDDTTLQFEASKASGLRRAANGGGGQESFAMVRSGTSSSTPVPPREFPTVSRPVPETLAHMVPSRASGSTPTPPRELPAVPRPVPKLNFAGMHGSRMPAAMGGSTQVGHRGDSGAVAEPSAPPVWDPSDTGWRPVGAQKGKEVARKESAVSLSGRKLKRSNANEATWKALQENEQLEWQARQIADERALAEMWGWTEERVRQLKIYEEPEAQKSARGSQTPRSARRRNMLGSQAMEDEQGSDWKVQAGEQVLSGGTLENSRDSDSDCNWKMA